jgi:cytosine permease
MNNDKHGVGQNAVAGGDFALERVPPEHRRPMPEVLWIELGIVTATSEFVLAATLGYSMSLARAMIAVTVGTSILILIGGLIGIAGATQGLPSGLLARWCGFGKIGSAAISFVLSFGNLAWFGVQNSICAQAVQRATGGRLSFTLVSILTGSLLVVIAALGFKSLARTASLIVPLFVLVAAYGAYRALVGTPLAVLLHRPPAGAPMSIATGADLVVGSFIVGAVLAPDLTRFCRRGRDAFWVMAIALVAGQIVLGLAGVLLSHAAQTQDVISIIFQAAGWLGVTVVFLATVKLNDVNLYSTSLHLINAIQIVTGKELSRVKLTVVAGALGILFSILGILDHITQFLMLLGIIMAPVGGIVIADYFILRRHRAALASTQDAHRLQDAAPVWSPWSFAAWFLGAAAGLLIHTGVTTLNAVLVSALSYCVMVKGADLVAGRSLAPEQLLPGDVS